MSSVSLEYSGVLDLQQKIKRAIKGVPQEVRAVNRRWVPRLRAMLIAHSSGRPGPQVITGAYNAAYVVQTENDDLSVTADNPSPQSDRLENGYVGVDALGRHYHQPPFAHFRPTAEEASGPYAEDVGDAFGRWWG